ncbi:deoxynucleoside kinase, partial [Streptococcus sp.]|uniref:deoxynucleoside kinase n=1 Tax=Streptococcus sp. TaxID=1306 RepID=UPI00391A46EA
TYINTLQGSISQEEYAIYLELLDNMMEEIDALPKKAPDLLIYLDGSFESIMANIKKRGRSYEQVDANPELLAYYKLLHKHYSQWYEDYNYGPKMKISTDDLDIAQEADWQKAFGLIEQEMKKLGLR